MAYKYEEKLGRNHSSRSSYGASNKPTGITIHHWGSDGQSHNGVVNYLNRSGGNTSAHLVVSSGLVTRLVNDNRAAWHAGHRTGNGTTIGIEMRPEMSAGDWNTLVELCADLEEIHGSLKYYRHSDWKATACPGRYGPRIKELVDAINAEHARRKSGKKPAKKASTPKKAAKKKNVRSEASIRRICIRATEGTSRNSTGHLIGLYQLAQLSPFTLVHDQHWGNVTDQHYRWVHRLQVEMNKWKGNKVNENGTFNSATRTRIKELQRRNHGGAYPGWAKVDGVAGPVFCKMLGIRTYPN